MRRSDRFSGLLRANELEHRFLITIGECFWIEGPLLRINDMAGKVEHLVTNFDIGNIGEIGAIAARLVIRVQDRPKNSLVPRLKKDQPLGLQPCVHSWLRE